MHARSREWLPTPRRSACRSALLARFPHEGHPPLHTPSSFLGGESHFLLEELRGACSSGNLPQGKGQAGQLEKSHRVRMEPQTGQGRPPFGSLGLFPGTQCGSSRPCTRQRLDEQGPSRPWPLNGRGA